MNSHTALGAGLGHLRRITTRLLLGLLFITSANLSAAPLLNGLAPHIELGQEQFLAALYVDSPSSAPSTLLSANEHKRMELRITARRLSTRRLNSLWIEGMAINVPGSLLTKHADNMVKFTSLLKGRLVAGDILSIDTAPGEGTRVSLNGVELGQIYADGFFELLLRTWIGSVPLSSDFRDNILKGGGEVDAELVARFQAITPRKGRVAAIEAWLQEDTPPTVAPPEVAKDIPRLPDKPQVSAPRLAIASAPKLAQPNGKPKSAKGKPKIAAPHKPAPKVAAATKAPEPEDIDEAPEEEPEDPAEVFTAESLLSRQLYHSKLLKWTYKYISYPKRAISRGQEGSVRLAVVIDRKGKVKQVSPVEESRYSTLNKEALGAVKRAEPFPPVPDEVGGKEFEFSLPIVFRLPK